MLGLLTFTSARTGNGHRRAFLNYDDLYVLEFAYRHGGCVLSGDRFTDILNQHSYRFVVIINVNSMSIFCKTNKGKKCFK